MTPETKIKTLFKKFLRAREQTCGGRFWWGAISDRFHAGLPDYFIVMDGEACFVEAKTGGEWLKPRQQYEMARLLKAGANCYVITMKEGKLCLIQVEKGGGRGVAVTPKSFL